MNRIFGGPKQPQKTAPQQQQPAPVVQPKAEIPEKNYDLSETSKRMEGKVRELSDTVAALEKEIAEMYKKAKNSKGSSAQSYKSRCVMLLKKKKMYEGQLQSYLSQQLNIDQLAFTKENIQNNIETAQAMKQAVNTQKNIMKDLNLDEVEDLKDEMEDMMWETDQINDTLNRNYNLDIDEMDLDNEMKELDDELFKEAISNPQGNHQMPAYYQSAMQSNKEANINKI